MISGQAFAEAAVELAKRTPPIPYVMGGTTLKGMDCRGLPMYLIRQMGYPNYRTAGATSMWRDDCVDKTTLTQAQLRPGDLLFIRDGDVSEHMGIYCGAPGYEVVHASASKGCVCASTIKNGWTHAARHRLIGEKTEAEAMDIKWVGEVATQSGPLNLRDEPDLTGTRIAQIPKGERINVLWGEPRDGWLWAQWGGRTGYVSAQYVRDIESIPDVPPTEEPGEDMVSVPRMLLEQLCDWMNS